MIKGIKDSSEAYVEVNDKFQVRVDRSLLEQEKTITAFSRKLEESIDVNHTKQQATKSLVHGQNQELRDMNKKIERFNEGIQSKFDQAAVDVLLRVKQDDMKQNFKKLNDLL